MRVAWLVCAAACVAGCGVLSGLDSLSVPDGSALDDASDAGATEDVALDIGPSCESGTCGAPSGFQPVLFASAQSTPCPGSSTTNDVLVDPEPSENACTCACAYQPQCLPQPLDYTQGTTCSQAVSANVSLDGGCNVGSGGIPPSHAAVGPFSPTNACASKLTSVGTVTSTPGRLCSVTDCTACAANAPFELCFVQVGDVACPSNGMKKHVVASSAQVQCSACGACTSTAKCKGTLSVYDDNACFDFVGAFTVDGTCSSLANVDDLGSFKYAPSVDNGTCTPGTSTASVNMSARATICCP